MKLETLNIADIREYDRNARTHSPAQVRQIAASIREFGFNDPVAVDEDNVLIEGHGRLAAARLLNMIEVPALRLGHLTPAQRDAYVLAHNRIALNSGWDEDMLREVLDDLGGLVTDLDPEALGFDAGELDALFAEYTGAPDTAALDNHAGAGLSDPPPPDPAPAAAPPIRVPILIELTAAENARWNAIKKALGTGDNGTAFRHVAGIGEIQP